MVMIVILVLITFHNFCNDNYIMFFTKSISNYCLIMTSMSTHLQVPSKVLPIWAEILSRFPDLPLSAIPCAVKSRGSRKENYKLIHVNKSIV